MKCTMPISPKHFLSVAICCVMICLHAQDDEMTQLLEKGAFSEAAALCERMDGEAQEDCYDMLERAMRNTLRNTPELIYEDFASELDFANFSPDGRYILAGGRIDDNNGDYPIHLWDLNTGKMIRSYGEVKKHGDGWLLDAQFTPDGKYIVSRGRELRLIDFKTGEYLWEMPAIVWCFSISEDGKYIAAALGADNKLALIETRTGMLVKDFGKAPGDYTMGLDFSPDGSTIASYSYNDVDRAIHLWDIESGTKISSMKGHLKGINRIMYSPDGMFILSGGWDWTIRLWDAELGMELRTWRDVGMTSDDVGFLNDGNSIFVATGDLPISIVEIDIDSDQRRTVKRFLNTLDSPYDFKMSPGGEFLLVKYEHSIRLLDMESGTELPAMISFNNYNDWLLTYGDGRFEATKGAMERIFYEFENDYLPLESFYERFYSPSLFKASRSGMKKASETGIRNIQLPPSVVISKSVSGFASHDKNIQVTVTATDKGGGIDEIRLYQNSKLINSRKMGGGENSLVSDVKLVSVNKGVNVFKAVAMSKDRTESKPEQLVVRYTGSEDSKPNLYVISVGINIYKNKKYNLNYAYADAKAIAGELENANTELFAEKHITFIENNKATKENIMKEFERIKKEIMEQDVFVFYFAGHGMLSEGSLEDKNYYLVMHDVVNIFGDPEMLGEKALSTSELKHLSQNLNAQKQIFLMDACQSGGAVELLAQRGIVEEKAIAQLARSTGTYWFAASESEQYATEFASIGHGVFTYSILQGLAGGADASKDGVISVKELSMFLEEAVPRLSEQYKGTEQYPLSYGFGQDFPLVLKPE